MRVSKLSAGLAATALAVQPLAAADRPEPGLQGQSLAADKPGSVLAVPYSKGVRRIGHNPIDGRSGNLIMAWSGHCAYVAGGMGFGPNGAPKAILPGSTSGVAVLDVANPKAPRLVRYLQDKGALNASETMHAVTAPGRAVLAASTYGGVSGYNAPKEGWLSIYDVSDCANPRLLSEVLWPEPAHTITVSPDGKRVYGTIINPFTGGGGIQVMDISDPAKPHFAGRFGATRADGSSFEFAAHELRLSPDGRRIYVGAIGSKGGDLNRGIKLMPPNAKVLGPQAGGLYVLDNSDLAEGKPDPKMRLLGTAQHAGWHSPALARIGGKPYVVNAGELGACPGAWPKITDLGDETNPRVVGEFRLAMNHEENCPQPGPVAKASFGISGDPGTATTHFNDVDSETDTRLGLFPFMYAGLRIVDLRNPARPVEVAYFKPGDVCGSHVRYVPETGHIWFACTDSGFHVIALDPKLRARLGYPRR